jgi:hypothetical protein
VTWFRDIGIALGLLGALGAFVDEWFYGLLHPFDFKGREKIAEPIRRAMFHGFYVVGLGSLLIWGVWVTVSAIVGLF